VTGGVPDGQSGTAAGVKSEEGMLQVTIDLDRCQGHARCLECAPTVFDYDDVTNQAFVRHGADLEGNRDAISQAERGCPELAIRVDEKKE
jgi:ferredoxin